jgi:hypothetical protein
MGGRRTGHFEKTGRHTGFRDPSGNNIRLTQILEFDPSRGTTP